MTLDHDAQNKSESNLKRYRQVEEFAKAQEVDFFPAGRGIGYQIMCEEGYAFPGTMTVASDSQSNKVCLLQSDYVSHAPLRELRIVSRE